MKERDTLFVLGICDLDDLLLFISLKEEQSQRATNHQHDAGNEHYDVGGSSEIIQLAKGHLCLKKGEENPQGKEGRDDRDHLAVSKTQVQRVNLDNADGQRKDSKYI
eukprot:CAMPEP_0181501612 /NCGR_PEP_ID=MMETSP1110-20121109/55890_1 /TAXON_ID=174948 /ORGANISM="Symbiodinium sp., Strain CCMP421" /LENGTH=106 /DNA_ID=CAMNT_0023630087 /DNA_START=166 /DNA_END=486 /DNA_ORIENTATION=-